MTTSTAPPSADATVAAPSPTEAFARRLLESALGMFDMMSIHLGDKLGWYRSLGAHGPATPAELAGRTGTDERYAREWLEQQAVTGLLELEPGEPRRFALSPAAAEVLTDEDSLVYLAPLARMFGAVGVQLPALVEAYRTGGGVGWAQYGVDMRESQAAMNRPYYRQLLAGAMSSLPDLDAVLRRPGARVADVGCGGGWSTIALAQAYPDASFHGFDIDAPSVDLAQANLLQHPDLAGRVSFTRADAASLPESGFDVAFAFECIHDLPAPVEVLGQVRRSLRPGAPMVVMDEAVADEFTVPGDELERLMYGFSLSVCLPDGRSRRPSAATGTVMRPSTLRGYAERAGFSGCDVLPIEDFGFWRFYLLTG